MIVEHITDLIGNTPLLRIPEAIHGIPNLTVYAKLEMMNPMGSVKDRIAWNMIKDDIAAIKADGKMIVENSSGNTAKALQAIASSYGVPFRLISAIAKVQEGKDILRLIGAEIEELAGSASDCFDPNDPNDPQYYIERAAKDSNGKIYFTSQFTNQRNVDAHYNGTAVEILADLPQGRLSGWRHGHDRHDTGYIHAAEGSQSCAEVCRNLCREIRLYSWHPVPGPDVGIGSVHQGRL